MTQPPTQPLTQLMTQPLTQPLTQPTLEPPVKKNYQMVKNFDQIIFQKNDGRKKPPGKNFLPSGNIS